MKKITVQVMLNMKLYENSILGEQTWGTVVRKSVQTQHGQKRAQEACEGHVSSGHCTQVAGHGTHQASGNPEKAGGDCQD